MLFQRQRENVEDAQWVCNEKESIACQSVRNVPSNGLKIICGKQWNYIWNGITYRNYLQFEPLKNILFGERNKFFLVAPW